MRATLLTAAALAGAAAPAQAATADLMVVGKHGVLRAPGPVRLKPAKVRVAGRTCRVAARTPLAALARTSLALKLHDYGTCSKDPSNATQLYLRGIGRQVEQRTDGWVYKVGRSTPSVGAADPAGRLKRGAHVLWFWCRSGADGCQRTLEAAPSTRIAAPGEAISAAVTGYDDTGGGEAVPDATVRLGGAVARTGPTGVASLTVPAGAAGTLKLVATAPGLVRSFPVEVRIG